MTRRIAGGPVPAAAAGLLALVVFTGFLGLTLTADRLLREGPAGPLLGRPTLTTSVDLAASTTTLRRQAQSPSETIRRTLVRAAVASFGETIGPALVAAAVPAPVVAAVTGAEPAASTFGEPTKGKAGSKGKSRRGSSAASRVRKPSETPTASSDRKEDSRSKGKPEEAVSAAGSAEKSSDKTSDSSGRKD